MKHLENNLEHMNMLLLFSLEVEQIYFKVLATVKDDNLEAILKDAIASNRKFNAALKAEIVKFGGTPASYRKQNIKLNATHFRFKRALNNIEDSSYVIIELCKIKELNIKACNALLQERHLPLSVCKLLIAQKDDIQAFIGVIKTRGELVA